MPNPKDLPKGMRAWVREIDDRRGADTDPGGADAMTLDRWPEEAKSMVEDLFPTEEPGVEPHPWNRIPNWPASSPGI